MPRRISFLLLIPIILSAGETDITGPKLLEKIITDMNPENARGIMTQTITTSSGEQRTFKYEAYMGNRGECSLMRYLEPARVKGNAMLMTDYSDNIWMYNRRTDRVRKLASSAKNQKFEGSDFTYEDLGSGDSWKKDYTPVLQGTEKIEGIKCYKLELQAKSGDLSYRKMVCFVRMTDLFPIQIDYYDKNEVLTKTLYLQDIREIEGILTPLKMVMQNRLDNTATVMEYLEITYKVSFDKDFFTERNLKR
jgi:outer membrane lipoprotein-sorting protein